MAAWGILFSSLVLSDDSLGRRESDRTGFTWLKSSCPCRVLVVRPGESHIATRTLLILGCSGFCKVAQKEQGHGLQALSSLWYRVSRTDMSVFLLPFPPLVSSCWS